MVALLKAVALGVAALVCWGCAESSTGDEIAVEAEFESKCPRSLTRPFAADSVIRIARKHGVSLRRENDCAAYIGEVESLSNAVDTTSEEFDAITAREGHVMCKLSDDPPPHGPLRVDRVKYAEDEETHLTVGNVQCTIYPARPEQIERLHRALAAVARGPVVRSGCPRGKPAPIGYERLVRTARAHGIELLRDERCGGPGVVARASNVLWHLGYTETGPQWDVIEAEQGHVTCLLRAGGGPAAVQEDEAIVTTRLRYRNVSCTISPTPDTNEDQVNALRAAFDDLNGG